MAGTKSQGSRVYYANTGTSWVALAAGAYPTTGFTQVTRGVSIDGKPHEVEKYDNSSLNDTSPSPAIELKPSGFTFTREKDSNSATLRALCDGTTSKLWCIVYTDGTADTCNGYLTCTSSGKADKGFANRVNETYEIIATDTFTHRASA